MNSENDQDQQPRPLLFVFKQNWNLDFRDHIQENFHHLEPLAAFGVLH